MTRSTARDRTPFHKAFRAIQLDYGIRLATVSKALGMTTPAARRLIARPGPVPPWLPQRLTEAFGLSEADRRFLEQAAEATAPAALEMEPERARIVDAFTCGLVDVGHEGDDSADALRIRRLLGARS